MKYSRIIVLNKGYLVPQTSSLVVDIIPNDLHLKYEKLYQKFKNNKLKSNTTVYLTPLSLFPSYKLKNYIEENKLNIQTARKTEKLNTLIINNDFIREEYSLTKEEKYYVIPYDIIVKDFSSFINKSNSWNDISKIPPHHLSKKDKNEVLKSFIMLEKDLNEAIKYQKLFSKLLNCPTVTGEIITKSHGNSKACDHLEFFSNIFDLIEKNNLDVVFDDNINSAANKDTVIDLETFQTLYSMLSSADINNWSIAREIIANSDYNKSKPYILFLVKIFDFLKNKSGNVNYHLIYKYLLKENKKMDTILLSKWHTYDVFIQKITNLYPSYNQNVCDCLTTHLNHLFKTSIIKTIHSL